MNPFLLRALDGSNLLGYLAALGVLETLPGARMRWVDLGGVWMPEVEAEADDEDALVAVLAERLGVEPRRTAPEYLTRWANYPDATEFAEMMKQARANPDSWDAADRIAALGAATEGEDARYDTGFRTMGGAGHQDFFGFLAAIHQDTTVDHLREALFEGWRYENAGLAMRWDPVDYRPHALRAEDPSSSKNKPVSVRGANRLALEGLAGFRVMPRPREGATLGFDGTTVRWALWGRRCGAMEVRCLIAIAAGGFGASELSGRGVEAIFEADRFTEGRFRNFSPSRQSY